MQANPLQRRIEFLVLSCFAAGWVSPAEASRFGRDGFSGNPGTNGGAVCTACHTPGAALPSLTLTGPVTVDAGQTYTFTAQIVGGPGITAGIGVSASASAGDFAALGPDLHLVGEEISHTEPKAFSSGAASFSFTWTAPAFNGPVTLYAAGNSSNGMLGLAGDAIATTTLSVNVVNGSAPLPPPAPPPPAPVALEDLGVFIDSPVVIAHAGDARLFVVERRGRIRIINADGSLAATPFLDISTRVDASGSEQGLLGLTFHPQYAQNGYFYVYYTRDPGPGLDRSRVARFRVSSNPALADAMSESVVLEFEQPFSNHNAGDIHFGPDGYLYIASGDGGSGGDPSNFAQNNASLLGKLLRIDVGQNPLNLTPDCNISGGSNYRVPRDNAYVNGLGGACDEIWAKGLRNPWRFSFDRNTGDLWIADVGQNLYEEVDFVPAGTAAGLDFGWRCYEGNASFNLSGCPSGTQFFPIHVALHSAGDCSITGGAVYRGSAFPRLYGRYFFSDFCNPSVRTITRSGTQVIVDTVVPTGAITLPAAFGENAQGELFVASLSGRIYRIVDPNPEVILTQVPVGGLVLVVVMITSLAVAGMLRLLRT